MKDQDQVRARLLKKASEDAEFRKELLQSPKSVIEKELGIPLPDGIQINVLEEKPDEYYLVLPLNPDSGTSQPLSEAQLESVAGGNCYMDCGCDVYCDT